MLCNCVEDLGCFLAGDPINFGLNALCDGTFTFEVSRRGLIERIEIDFVAGDPLILPNSFDEHGEIKVKIKFPEACADPTNGVSYVTSTRGACVFKFKNEVPVCSGGSAAPCPDPVPLVPIAASVFNMRGTVLDGPIYLLQTESFAPADPILPPVYTPTFRLGNAGNGEFSVKLDPPRAVGAPYIDFFGSDQGDARFNSGYDDGVNEFRFTELTREPYQLTFLVETRPSGSLDPWTPTPIFGDPDLVSRMFNLVLTQYSGPINIELSKA